MSYELTVFYGTETGNSKGIADKVLKKGTKNGVQVHLRDLAECSLADMKAVDHPFLVVISTWDDGAPPPAAVPFCTELAETSEDLSSLRFSVLALGDEEYPLFCECGKQIDQKLADQGATRILERKDLGADFMVSYMGWSKTFWKTMARVYGVAA